MKTCPTCGTSYSDDLSFCLDDGTRLPDQTVFDPTNRPTAIIRPETHENTDISTAETIASGANQIAPPPRAFQMSAVEPSTRMGCALTIGQVAAGLLVVVGLGIVGIFFTSRITDVAYLGAPKSAPVPAANAANSAGIAANAANISMNTNGAPQISATKGAPAPTLITTTSTPEPKMTPVIQPQVRATPMFPNPVARRTISGGVLNGKATSLPKPPYPPAARAVRASGAVTVQVMIDETGRVLSATAVSGHPLLRNAAEQAARGARFSPTLLGGEPVKVSGVIVYNFVP